MSTGSSRGRLIGTVHADGTSESLGYDASGRLAWARDEIGRQVGFAYDALDRLSTATDAGSGQTVFGYDLRGLVRRQVLPDGTAVATGLAPSGDVAWQELSGWVAGAGADPAGPAGNPAAGSGPRLRTEYGYDVMGRVIQRRLGVVAGPGQALPRLQGPGTDTKHFLGMRAESLHKLDHTIQGMVPGPVSCGRLSALVHSSGFLNPALAGWANYVNRPSAVNSKKSMDRVQAFLTGSSSKNSGIGTVPILQILEVGRAAVGGGAVLGPASAGPGDFGVLPGVFASLDPGLISVTCVRRSGLRVSLGQCWVRKYWGWYNTSPTNS